MIVQSEVKIFHFIVIYLEYIKIPENCGFMATGIIYTFIAFSTLLINCSCIEKIHTSIVNTLPLGVYIGNTVSHIVT